MNMNEKEALLSAWMDMALNIRGDRIVEGLSFNEIVVYSFLYRAKKAGEDCLTATQIGERTKLLKSQLNKVLNDLESKELISRVRSTEDKRKVYIKLNDGNLSVYLEAHKKVMEVVSAVWETLGDEKARQLTQLLKETVQAVQKVR